MARPQKKGLDYFPLDVTMDRTDDDIEMLEAKYGVEGFCILIKLYMKIYQEEGYFIKWGEKSGLLHSKRVNVDFNRVNEVINDLVQWGVFDDKLFEEYTVLTSKRIQETYMEAVKKRKDVTMITSILLLDEVNSNINLVDSDIYPKRKEKKRKVDKTKELDVVNREDKILNYWNSKEKLTSHKMTDNMKKAIKKIKTDDQAALLCKAINRYYSAFTNPNVKYDHKWTLDKFIKQSNGYVDWLDEGARWVSVQHQLEKGGANARTKKSRRSLNEISGESKTRLTDEELDREAEKLGI